MTIITNTFVLSSFSIILYYVQVSEKTPTPAAAVDAVFSKTTEYHSETIHACGCVWFIHGIYCGWRTKHELFSSIISYIWTYILYFAILNLRGGKQDGAKDQLPPQRAQTYRPTEWRLLRETPVVLKVSSLNPKHSYVFGIPVGQGFTWTNIQKMVRKQWTIPLKAHTNCSEFNGKTNTTRMGRTQLDPESQSRREKGDWMLPVA